MYNYCTLFNSTYLTRGLAMYESLSSAASNFHLYIFPFDDDALKVLNDLNLKNVTVVPLSEFEDEKLLEVKPFRSVGEYCWTSTPSVIRYCLQRFGLDNCTYLDADLYFYSDPSPLIEEMGSASVLLTEHRYSRGYDKSARSGIYCVQFMTFKNTESGFTALEWWRDACIDWCYDRVEDGKFGDQKYLDDWPVRFSGIHVLKNRAGGVAPWNIQQYRNFKPGKDIIFYHFHKVRFLKGEKVYLGGYPLSREVVNEIYRPYITHLEKIRKRLNVQYPDVRCQEKADPDLSLKGIARFLLGVLRGTVNTYSLQELVIRNG